MTHFYLYEPRKVPDVLISIDWTYEYFVRRDGNRCVLFLESTSPDKKQGRGRRMSKR